MNRIVVDADESKTCITLDVFLTAGRESCTDSVLPAAQSSDAPLKLTFPRPRSGHQGGYGDVILCGGIWIETPHFPMKSAVLRRNSAEAQSSILRLLHRIPCTSSVGTRKRSGSYSSRRQTKSACGMLKLCLLTAVHQSKSGTAAPFSEGIIHADQRNLAGHRNPAQEQRLYPRRHRR